MKINCCSFQILQKWRHWQCGSLSLVLLGLLLVPVEVFAETDEAIQTFRGHSDSVESIALSSNGNKVLSGSHDNTMKLWNVETGELENTFQEHTDFVMSVAFSSSDGTDVLSGSADGTLKRWRNGKDTAISPLEEPIGLVYSVAFSPDGNYVLTSGSRHNEAKFWNIKTGSGSGTSPTHESWIYLVAFSPDGKKALSASDDGVIMVWDFEKNDQIDGFFQNTGHVWSVAFSPKNDKLLYGDDSGVIKVMDVSTKKEISTLKGHTGRVYSLAVSNDGNKVLSGGHDGTIKLWNMNTGKETKSFQGHNDIVSSILFSHDGSRALSGSYDNTVKLWAIEGNIIKFSGVKEFYDIGDKIVVSLEETGLNRTEQIDLWAAIGTSTGDLFFITPDLYSFTAIPFKTSVDISATTHEILTEVVTPWMIGNYTLYGLYVEKGKNPITDGQDAWRSNLVSAEITLVIGND